MATQTQTSLPTPSVGISALFAEIDDWCGTKVPGRFPPRPHALRDVLISVAIHDLAAQLSDTRMREQIQALAATAHLAGGAAMAAKGSESVSGRA